MKTLLGPLTLVLLLVGFASSAFSQAGTEKFSGEMRGMTRLEGYVICVDCSLDETRKAHPHLNDLYLLKHDQHRVVMQIAEVHNTATGRESLQNRWHAVTDLTHELSVRATDGMWQTLVAGDDFPKPIEITGVLHSTRTFDIGKVTIPE